MSVEPGPWVPARPPTPRPIHWSEVIVLNSKAKSRHLVKGVLGSGEFSVVYGESSSGKTFFTISLAASVALGREWCGWRVAQGCVLYVPTEDPKGLGRRLAGYAQHHAIDTERAELFVAQAPLNLLDPESVANLIADANNLASPTALIVVDTLSRAFVGGDENSSVDMGRAVEAIARIRSETGAHVLAVHHAGKDSAKGARGHSLLRGAVDGEISVERTSDSRRAVIRKQRNGPDDLEIIFQLLPVTLGSDEDGDDITTCVAVPSEASAITPTKKKLSTRLELAFRALNELAAEGLPAPLEWGLPSSVRTVSLDAWRELLDSRSLLEGKNPRQQFSDRKEGLLRAAAIAVRDERVWPIR